MKKIILVLLMAIISTLGIYSYNANNLAVNFEEVNTIKLHVPASVKIIEIPDTSFINIHVSDKVKDNLIYDIDDSVLNIKMNKGLFWDWGVQNDDIKIKIGVPNVENLQVTTTNSLIISENKNIRLSNYENE